MSNISTFIRLRTQNAFGILNVNKFLSQENMKTTTEFIKKHEIILNDKTNKNLNLCAEVVLSICQIAKSLKPNINYASVASQTDTKKNIDSIVQTNNIIYYNSSTQVILN